MSGEPKVTPAEQPVIIERKNTLLAKAGGNLNPALAARAELAISQLEDQFPAWLAEMVIRLVAARQEMGETAVTAATREPIYVAALELKSLGETYGFMLISRFGHSLSRLLIRLEGDKAAPPELIDAHINAVKAVLRENMRDPNHPVGSALAAELERQVAALF